MTRTPGTSVALSCSRLAAAGNVAASGADDTVVIVEDDTALRRVLGLALSSHGFVVCETGTIGEAEGMITERRPAAILLDLDLPDGDGLELVRRVRRWSTTPIIILSARTLEGDKVGALDTGADDYLTKPFATNELLARIRAAIRRERRRREPRVADEILQIGPIRIDRARHEVTRDGRLVHLTPIEFQILVLLAKCAGRVITHAQFTSELWATQAPPSVHHLRVHIGALRRKLEDQPAQPRWILTVSGVGYRTREGGAKP